MIRLAIAVEGESEEEFVNLVLVEHLRVGDIETTPISLDGDINTPRLASNMAKLSWSFNAVTSLVDFYGFRGKGDATVEELERRIDSEIGVSAGSVRGESRVFAYVQQHEFEALLFSDVTVFHHLKDMSDELVESLQRIRNCFTTPEHIDESPATAPSKRIENALPDYIKSIDGPLLAEQIGLRTIRRECPRFNEWVTRMESLSNVQPAEQ